MSLADVRTNFLATRIAQRLTRRGLFREKAPGALAAAVAGTFAAELVKERSIDDDARRMLDGMRSQIASQGADANELYRKIRKKLAEQKGIVL